MKNLATLAAAASVFLMPFAANASLEGTYVGDVTVSKGLTFSCELTAVVTGNPAHPNYLTTLSLKPGNILCLAISLNNQPYTTVAHPDGSYTIYDINVTTITPGDCNGNAEGVYDVDGLEVDVVLPASTSGSPCTIDGYLEKQ